MGSAKSAMAPTGNRPFCGSAFWRVRVPTLEPDQQVAVAGLVRPIFPGAPDLDRIGAVAAVAGLDLVSIAIRRCSNSSNASPIVPTLPLSTGWPKIANGWHLALAGKFTRQLLPQFSATNCRPSLWRFGRPLRIEESSGTRGPPSRGFGTPPARHAISRRTTPACVSQELLGSLSAGPKSLDGGVRPRNRPKRISVVDPGDSWRVRQRQFGGRAG